MRVLPLLFLLCGVRGKEDACTPLHAEAPGIRLVCCSRTQRPPPSCSFSRLHYCHSGRCRCHVDVDPAKLNCSRGAAERPYAWADHQRPQEGESVSCSSPAFPNPSSAFLLRLRAGASPLLSPLLAALAAHRLVSLQVGLLRDGRLPALPDLPALRTLIVAAEAATDQEGPPEMDGAFLPALAKLEVLRLRNLSRLVEPFASKPLFLSSLRRLQIEAAPLLGDVWGPWLKEATALRQVRVEGTALEDPSNLFLAPSLRFLHVSRNRIRRLTGGRLDSASLEELSLAHNQITHIEGAIFGRLPKLKQLDLSHNPLTHLPPRAFETLGSLEFLNLDFTQLLSISAGHFLGLSALTHLSLQGNPQLRLEPFSLLPLNALETMDLRRCNLTQLPEATTQACGLRRIWFNFNLLHSSAALPPETVLQLIRLSQLSFSENPLLANPTNLLLLPRDNVPLLHSVIVSLKQVPVWWGDVCTALTWHLHLVQDPVLPAQDRKAFGRLFPSDPGARMSAAAREACKDAYAATMARLQPYQGLVVSGRCETVRRLRSLDDRFQAQQTRMQESSSSLTSPGPRIVPPTPPPPSCRNNNPLLVSMFFNLLCLAGLISAASVALCRRACADK